MGLFDCGNDAVMNKLILFAIYLFPLNLWATCESFLIARAFRAEVAHIDQLIDREARAQFATVNLPHDQSHDALRVRIRNETEITYRTLVEVRERLAIQAIALPEWLLAESSNSSRLKDVSNWVEKHGQSSLEGPYVNFRFDTAMSFRLRFMAERLNIAPEQIVLASLELQVAMCRRASNSSEAVRALLSAPKPPETPYRYGRQEHFRVMVADQLVETKIPRSLIGRLTDDIITDDFVERIAELSIYNAFYEFGFRYTPPRPGLEYREIP
jgi:hypothetical protein